MPDPLPLSALAHLLFCRRRAALVHVENAWAESVATAEGRVLHHKVDSDPRLERRGDVLVARMLPLRSERLGLFGVADSVEFHRDEAGARLPGVAGRWRPFPVEYKRGKLRREAGYLVQLCAQGMCLEEMLGVDVPAGALFFGTNRRRLAVNLDQDLRAHVQAAAEDLHGLIRSESTPAAEYERAKCAACSMKSLCLPGCSTGGAPVAAYLRRMLECEEDA
ncbi:CRISPR-associated protein Cas4 [Alkalidesulfovibrio alkalitolerans DSM 16529]|uniref:CRISPR-associated exonuclease Cas4 n=1 Tax=Alkalidesulfovibrio alkalitolerans DSM 16529 TaxID=1121439 RepID=S7UP70_9BACT|nr:CRISPR-associated protein Cas4 [Alkalidesulfovibrio alkalitolerans]EPR34123.1 CRISPR-associated protein Cas4 [Alkalidesulfovibrio alkalitolerans DSM 16529]